MLPFSRIWEEVGVVGEEDQKASLLFSGLTLELVEEELVGQLLTVVYSEEEEVVGSNIEGEGEG